MELLPLTVSARGLSSSAFHASVQGTESWLIRHTVVFGLALRSQILIVPSNELVGKSQCYVCISEYQRPLVSHLLARSLPSADGCRSVIHALWLRRLPTLRPLGGPLLVLTSWIVMIQSSPPTNKESTAFAFPLNASARIGAK